MSFLDINGLECYSVAYNGEELVAEISNATFSNLQVLDQETLCLTRNNGTKEYYGGYFLKFVEQSNNGYTVHLSKNVNDLTDKALSAMQNNMTVLSGNVRATSIMAKYSFRQASIYMTDSEITEVLEYVSEWASNRKYYTGQVLSYDGKYYRVSQDHTSQDQWLPGSQGTEALYYEIVIAPDGILVWKKPSGAHDAPNKNDLRHYPNEDSPVYRSLIDGNAYSPDEYAQGWELYTEE